MISDGCAPKTSTMQKRLVYYLLVAGSLLLPTGAQGLDNQGKSFLIPFTPNFGDNTEYVILISSQHNATVYINNPNLPQNGRDQEYTVQSGVPLHVKLDASVAISTNQVVEKKAVLVVSSQPITVYGFSLENRSSDGYLALPMKALGTRYVVATYDTSSAKTEAQLAVAATEDDTEVTVTVRVLQATTCGDVTLTTQDRTQLHFVLHAQDVVRVLCDGDVTGSYVNSSKPVAVVSGNVCAKVPTTDTLKCDHLVEMMVPVSSLGSRYLLHTFQGRDDGAIYRVVYSEQGTQIDYGPGLTPMELGGDLPFYQFPVNKEELQTGVSAGMLLVVADKPILVVGYSMSQKHTTNPSQGDTFMTLLPSPDLAPSSYVLDFDLSRYYGNRNVTCYFTAVVNSTDAEGVRVGGQKLVMQATEEGLSIASQEILSWPTRVNHVNPLVSLALDTHCWAPEEGLGFPAGYTLTDFTGVDECASSPCDNGGVCYGVGSSFRCHCVGVFGGHLCRQDVVNDCDSNPCSNGATCQDGLRAFTCVCLPGYTGLACNDVVTTTEPPLPTTVETTTEEPTTTEPTTTTTTTTTPPPLTMTATQEKPPPPPKRLCPCSCLHVQLEKPEGEKNATAVERENRETIQEIKEELAVDAKNTSKQRNRHHSAVDRRSSATGVGLVSVSLLAVVLGFVVLMDAATLVSFLLRKLRQHRETAGVKVAQPVKVKNRSLDQGLGVKDADLDAVANPAAKFQDNDLDEVKVKNSDLDDVKVKNSDLDPVTQTVKVKGSVKGCGGPVVQSGESSFHRELAAACSLISQGSDQGLAQVEVSRFVESVAMEGCHGNSPPKHRGSRRKHLLHVRPDTILLHVKNHEQADKDQV